MSKKFLWKIGGISGNGLNVTALNFAKIAARYGYDIFHYDEYPSLIKGGHNTHEVVISNEPVYGRKEKIDLLLCLNKDTYNFHKSRLTPKSLVIHDEEDFKINESECIKINVPFKKILKEEAAIPIMRNNIALGASLALIGFRLDELNKMIEKAFAKKGEPVIEKNQKLAKRGHDFVRENFAKNIILDFPQKTDSKKIVLTGNDAFSLGAIVADCRLYCAYPMTPSSSVLTTLAGYAQKTGMIVRHAEDEISVAMTAAGASANGARSAIGTAGGGFALMVEAISFMGMAEIPLVMFLAQRPAPATGMPTWTEQGDLLFAVHAGHGDFPKIVLAPGDVCEMYQLGARAFDLADIYQTPVIVMSDKILSESHITYEAEKFNSWSKKYQPNRGKIIRETKEQKYLRYKITDDGISPMLIPGQRAQFYQANSYEHLEDGHTTELAEERVKQVDKRGRKIETYLKNDFQMPRIYGDINHAKTVFVSWGGMKGVILEAMKELENKGKKTAFIHFTHLYPLDEKKVQALFKEKKRYILVENNFSAQFGRLLREQTGIGIKEKILKYDGRPFWTEEIVAKLKDKI